MLDCPDCGRPMEVGGIRLDPLDSTQKPILRCNQCKRWLFYTEEE
jgi:hypothetical protein